MKTKAAKTRKQGEISFERDGGCVMNGWETTTIGEEFDLFAGGDVDKEHFSQVRTDVFKYPIYANVLQREGLYGFTSIPRYKNDSITVTGRGDVGVAMYRNTDFDAIVRLLVLTPKPKSKADSLFTTYLIQKCVDFPMESTGVPQLTVPQIRNVELTLPPLPEQRRIAAVLSDTDALISAQEKLIAKKRAVKQGAMRELLTGKKRLLGFSGEWVEKTVEEIVERFATGLNHRQNFTLNTGGSNYYVTIKNFFDGTLYLNNECDKVDNTALDLINARSDLRKDDILFSSIGRVGDTYLVKETPRNWNINESVFTLRPNKAVIAPLFLYYLLKSDYTQRALSENSTGSTLTSIKMGHLKVIVLPFPKDTSEQAAIAQILSNMDAEIDALATNLNKLRNIKQGMMGELLTGRIRLPGRGAKGHNRQSKGGKPE
ncbi:MAG: restriction endonuclease subunit S [Chitinispirillales bacterium]|jgi:type I restriction enzyme S subunit|nr:restriction endonuclease subunit S [Chitinispirillales bacterium]